MKWTGKAILPHFGHLRPDNVVKKTCIEYEALRRAAGKSQGTVHTELGHLRSALKFTCDTRMIKTAPKIWRPAKPLTDKRILSAGEARALIDGAIAPTSGSLSSCFSALQGGVAQSWIALGTGSILTGAPSI